jgi:hypothetical protein
MMKNANELKENISILYSIKSPINTELLQHNFAIKFRSRGYTVEKRMAETQTLKHLILVVVMLFLTTNIGMAYNVGTSTKHNPGNIKDRVVYVVQ